MGVGGDQGHPAQAAGDHVPEEAQPPGAVLGGGDLQTQDLPVPVGVDTCSHQGVHVHDPAALADLQRQGVGGNERVWAGVQRAGPEVGDLLVELLGHDRDLGLRSRVMPRVSTSFSIRRVDTPSR